MPQTFQQESIRGKILLNSPQFSAPQEFQNIKVQKNNELKTATRIVDKNSKPLYEKIFWLVRHGKLRSEYPTAKEAFIESEKQLLESMMYQETTVGSVPAVEFRQTVQNLGSSGGLLTTIGIPPLGEFYNSKFFEDSHPSGAPYASLVVRMSNLMAPTGSGLVIAEAGGSVSHSNPLGFALVGWVDSGGAVQLNGQVDMNAIYGSFPTVDESGHPEFSIVGGKAVRIEQAFPSPRMTPIRPKEDFNSRGYLNCRFVSGFRGTPTVTIFVTDLAILWCSSDTSSLELTNSVAELLKEEYGD